MHDLASKTCVPCRGGVPPLTGEELVRLAAELGHGWTVVDGHHLEKTYQFPDFLQALEFTRRVGEMCEEQGHHGDIHLAWGKVKLQIWTHKIDGLTESDFVWAAKAERLAGGPVSGS
jgi:4a-hydroxytetrahydrobiopterin dehydratase